MKCFVLDTSVLLYDPQSIFAFEDNAVLIPLIVLEELDSKKTERGEVGGNARCVNRILDELRHKGSLSCGAKINEELDEDGKGTGEFLGRLYVMAENVHMDFKHLSKTNDNQIIGVAKMLADGSVCPADLLGKIDREKITLVTKDIAMRVKANSLGVDAQDYITDRVASENIGKVAIHSVDATVINALNDKRKLAPDDFDEALGAAPEAHENQCAIFRSEATGQSSLSRFSQGAWRLVNDKNDKLYSVSPRNAEQRFLADALMDEKIDLVVCNGVAGSGKTLLSMAAGFEHALNKKKHRGHHIDRLLITKAVQEVGNAIGFTPGTAEEKMAEWTKPFFDNMEFLLRKGNKSDMTLQEMQEKGLVEIDALAYIRGRSLMNRFIVIDECQNLPPNIIRTIVSRVADSSKLVLLGDFTQIDSPYLTKANNGLVYAMDRLQDEKSVAILNMCKSERSNLSKIAIEKL